MNKNKYKRIILVTGASKGIGNSIVNSFLKSSDNFVIGCSRSKISKKNVNYMHVETDLCKNKDINNLMQYLKSEIKRLDILINNAGVASMNHLLLTTEKKVDQIIDLNVKGVINLTREAAKLIKKSKNGRIINLSTVASPLFLEGESVYVASKSAIESFTKVIAKELNGFGITVNTIGPGPVKTDLIKNVSKEKINKILSQLTSKDFTTADDIINLINFLIKKESKLINGQTIYLG